MTVAPSGARTSAEPNAELTGVGMASLAAVGSLTPSSFRRPTGVQLGSTVLLALAGYGIGYGLAGHLDLIGETVTGSDDARVASAAAGGVGLGVWGATRLWARAGGQSSVIRPMLGSVGGVVGFAGLGGAAMLSAARWGGEDDDANTLVGAGVGIAAIAGTAIGILASRGRLSKAPTTLQAARRVVQVGDDAIAGITREAAAAMRAEQVAAAKASYVSRIGGGDPASWDRMGRQGKNFVSGTATQAQIAELTGSAAVGRPDRIYVGLGEASTPAARVELAMQRLEAAGAFDKGHVLLVAPVATGRFNPVLPFATEVFTGGDVTTVAIQTSARPPVFALHKLGEAGQTHRMLAEAIDQRITRTQSNTELLIHGHCYGGWAEQRAMLQNGIAGLRELGGRHALFQGTPGASATQRRAMRAVERGLEPDGLVARSSDELLERAAARSESPTVTWIINPDDPMRMRIANFWRSPERVPEQPVKRTFLPIVTAVNEILDAVVESRRLRGGFAEVGHDYRAGTPRAAKIAFGFDDVSDDLVARVEHEVARQEKLKLLASRA